MPACLVWPLGFAGVLLSATGILLPLKNLKWVFLKCMEGPGAVVPPMHTSFQVLKQTQGCPKSISFLHKLTSKEVL